MKRFILPTVFFYLCTFAAPHPARAAVGAAVIGAAAVGAAMIATSAGQYYAQNGQYPAYISNIAGGVASASDAIFQPSYLAYGPLTLVTAASFPQAATNYIAKTAHVGASVGDIVNFVQKQTASVYDSFKSLISSHSTVQGYNPSTVVPDSVIMSSGGLFFKVTSVFHSTNLNAASYPYYVSSNREKIVYGGRTGWLDGNMFIVFEPDLPLINGRMQGTCVNVLASVGPVTASEDQPFVDLPGLKDELSPVLPAGLAAGVQAALKEMPASQVHAKTDATTADSPAPALTAADLQAALARNTAEVAAKAAEAAQALAAANPTDAAAQIAAGQAAVEAAQAAEAAEATENKVEEETFPGIDSSAFSEPYNPGEYDISERFTSFLNTVKSSGLFSFSSSFFNSLPGGGSPVYEIDAGQYGHHTIDLSQTLSTGLAVLKTILLACFGFLSIRAVIMKR